MIWDEARWDGKIKEKWGKSYPDEAVAGRVQDYQDGWCRGSGEDLEPECREAAA
jgi:hypothetical protein